MSAFGQVFVDQLARESWTWYGIGVAIIALRTYARVRKLGIRGLDVDDYIMYLALVFYTLLIVTLNLTAQGAGSALALPGEDVFSLSPEEVKAREKGAKIDLLAEVGMLNTIWVLKACMLLLYSRSTIGVKSNKAVKYLAIYVAAGWVAINLCFFLECRPFKAYWQIAPSPSLACMVLTDYAAVQAFFNLTSDVLMLFIPIPLIWGVKVPIRQKLVLLVVFGMGFFVIAAALTTKIEFWTNIYSADYMFWYTREASVALYVANLPCIWPLLREVIPVLRSWTPGGTSGRYGKTDPTKGGNTFATGLRSMRHGTVNEIAPDEDRDLEMGKMGFSQPAITHKKQSEESDEDRLIGFAGGIRAETTIEMSVAERVVEDSESDKGSVTEIARA